MSATSCQKWKEFYSHFQGNMLGFSLSTQQLREKKETYQQHGYIVIDILLRFLSNIQLKNETYLYD